MENPKDVLPMTSLQHLQIEHTHTDLHVIVGHLLVSIEQLDHELTIISKHQ